MGYRRTADLGSGGRAPPANVARPEKPRMFKELTFAGGGRVKPDHDGEERLHRSTIHLPNEMCARGRTKYAASR